MEFINKTNWRLQVISKKKNDLQIKNETTKTLNQEIINIINDLAELENKSMQLKQKLQATKQDLYYLERQINLDKKRLKVFRKWGINNVDERRGKLFFF